MTDKNDSVHLGNTPPNSGVRDVSEQECEEEDDYVDEEEDEEDEAWRGESLEGAFDSFEDELKKKGFIYVGQGSFRRVYERGDIVIKVPTHTDGVMDNRVEHAAYHRYWSGPTPAGIYLTPCRLMANGCLMMKRITAMNYYDRPEWSKLIDGRQVGLYKGKPVAYDFALDLTDRFEWERQWKCESEFFNSREWRSRRPHIDSFLTELEKNNAASGRNSKPL